MRDEQFSFWLERHHKTAAGRAMARNARQSRISNCRRVEAYEGDLDRHWAEDGGEGLLARFKYARDQEARGTPPLHRIPIRGNKYEGTSTLASAARLYFKFCRAWPIGRSSPPS